MLPTMRPSNVSADDALLIFSLLRDVVRPEIRVVQRSAVH